MAKLETMLHEGVRPSRFEDALVGSVVAAAIFETGVVLGAADHVRELTAHVGPIADAVMLGSLALLVGGLAGSLYCARRLSREVATLRTFAPEPDALVSLAKAPTVVPEDVMPFRDLQPRRIPRCTSEL
jgi:hypothetical protein